MPLDPRSARALLKLAREFASDFRVIELSPDGSIRVERSDPGTGVPAPAPDKPRKKPDMPVRWAVDSVKTDPPPFHFPISEA